MKTASYSRCTFQRTPFLCHYGCRGRQRHGWHMQAMPSRSFPLQGWHKDYCREAALILISDFPRSVFWGSRSRASDWMPMNRNQLMDNSRMITSGGVGCVPPLHTLTFATQPVTCTLPCTKSIQCRVEQAQHRAAHGGK